MTIDLKSYKSLYLKTSSEYVQTMKRALDQLMKESADAEAIHTFFIAAHSLKGQSQIMQYAQMSGLCAELEHSYRALDIAKSQPSQALLSSTKDALDYAERDLDAIRVSDKEIDTYIATRTLKDSQKS